MCKTKQTGSGSVGDVEHAEVLPEDFDLDGDCACRLAEDLLAFVEVFGQDVKVVESRGRVHVVGEGAELPVAVGCPHLAL